MRRGMLALVLVLLVAGCGPAGRAAWSVFIPGVGQFMNGEGGKGALMLGLSVANNAAVAPENPEASVAVGLGLAIWSGVDAYQVAQRVAYADQVDAVATIPRPDQAPVVVVLDALNRQVSLTCRF